MKTIHQTRIFVNNGGLLDHPQWAEKIIGDVIKPAITIFQDKLEWYWFTRYVQQKNGDIDDCKFDELPQTCFYPQSGMHKSIRFRYSIEETSCDDFEKECKKLIDKIGCVVTDFREYDILGDLGGDRHLELPRDPERRKKRAELVVANYFSIAQLILDALIGPDGNGHFSLPHDHQKDPMQETPFHVFHHIFCNSTNVPLYNKMIVNLPSGPQEDARQEIKLFKVNF